MPPSPPACSPLEEGFRWYGPQDPVPLTHIRQTGASGVFTALHEIPYGEAWPQELIRARKELLRHHGLSWLAVESVPVHEDIKTGRGDLKTLFENYRQTLRHLGAEGIQVVITNFMPVLDWIRTDLHYRLPDGSECLRFDPVRFAAFEVHALQRPGAEEDYSEGQLAEAQTWWDGQSDEERAGFVQGIIDAFPGCKLGLSLDDIRAMLAPYAHVSADGLRANLARFLEAVVPAAEEAGVRLAMHPDDPPFSVLGLPRIVSTGADLKWLLKAVDSPANGICFCTGSLSVREENDLPALARRLGDRIHAVHLRSTARLPGGSFYEAHHLEGSVNMPAVVQALLDEQARRKAKGRPDWRLPFRPDHGHAMLDDLARVDTVTPGYTCIGRMRGLAELRGLMMGLMNARNQP